MPAARRESSGGQPERSNGGAAGMSPRRRIFQTPRARRRSPAQSLLLRPSLAVIQNEGADTSADQQNSSGFRHGWRRSASQSRRSNGKEQNRYQQCERSEVCHAAENITAMANFSAVLAEICTRTAIGK